MSSSGNIISWSNFDHAVIKSYDSGETHTSPIYLYVSAQSFHVRISCNSVALRTASVSCSFHYYDFTTNQWVHWGDQGGSCQGAGKAWDGYFYHNYNGNNTCGDHAKHTLWRCGFSSSTPGSCTARIRAWAGGPGYCSEVQYDSFCKGKSIMSAGRLGGDSFHASTSQDDGTALSLFTYTNGRGSSITAELQYKCIARWW